MKKLIKLTAFFALIGCGAAINCLGTIEKTVRCRKGVTFCVRFERKRSGDRKLNQQGREVTTPPTRVSNTREDPNTSDASQKFQDFRRPKSTGYPKLDSASPKLNRAIDWNWNIELGLARLASEPLKDEDELANATEKFTIIPDFEARNATKKIPKDPNADINLLLGCNFWQNQEHQACINVNHTCEIVKLPIIGEWIGCCCNTYDNCNNQTVSKPGEKYPRKKSEQGREQIENNRATTEKSAEETEPNHRNNSGQKYEKYFVGLLMIGLFCPLQ